MYEGISTVYYQSQQEQLLIILKYNRLDFYENQSRFKKEIQQQIVERDEELYFSWTINLKLIMCLYKFVSKNLSIT